VWTNGSSRERKENFADVDPHDVLDRLTRLTIRAWNYKAEGAAIRHIGPVAEEFYEQFKMGGDDKSIGTIDADGVALAAIQGLYEIVREKDCEMAELRDVNHREVEELRSEIEELKEHVSALAAQNGGGR
jgi:predicted transcriptional regulator